MNAVIEGRPITAIARELGVSRSWASREAHAPGTGSLINQLLASRPERLDGLLTGARDTLHELLQARKNLYGGSTAIDGGPDHRIQLKAVGLFLMLVKFIPPCSSAGQTSGAKLEQQSRWSNRLDPRLFRVVISIAELAAQRGAREQQQLLKALARQMGMTIPTSSGLPRLPRGGAS